MIFFNCNTKILINQEYPDYIRACIRQSRKYIFIEQFVIDVRSEHDAFAEIRHLLYALSDAVKRGVEVKVILACVLVGDILKVDINEPAAQFLLNRNVSVRKIIHNNNSVRQAHTKSILFDDKVSVIGSHNWTASSFRVNEETSIITGSKELSSWTKKRFIKQWKLSSNYDQIRPK